MHTGPGALVQGSCQRGLLFLRCIHIPTGHVQLLISDNLVSLKAEFRGEVDSSQGNYHKHMAGKADCYMKNVLRPDVEKERWDRASSEPLSTNDPYYTCLPPHIATQFDRVYVFLRHLELAGLRFMAYKMLGALILEDEVDPHQ